jgi:hypothetical protein
MMGHRDELKNGDEYDAIRKAPLCVYDNQSGLRRRAKKAVNRRARHEAKRKLHDTDYRADYTGD